MPITYGRGDIAALARRFRTTQTAARRTNEQMRMSGWVPPDEPERLDLLVYPTGWNVMGQPVQWDAESIGEHPQAGKVTTRGPSVRGAEMRARWKVAEALRLAGCDGEQARERARKAVVSVSMLDKRPVVGEVVL